MSQQKKLILKPGKHQFAAGSAAEHENHNICDEEAEWYIKMYPHIRSLFIEITDDAPEAAINKPVQKTQKVTPSDVAQPATLPENEEAI